VGAGGTVVVPHNSALLSAPTYLDATVDAHSLEPSLAYGQKPSNDGFHIMETPTDHWVETLTGLGATGIKIFLSHVGERPMQGHPLVPLLQISANLQCSDLSEDLDLALEARALTAVILQVLAVASRSTLQGAVQGNNTFQLTRGLLGDCQPTAPQSDPLTVGLLNT
jgi:hypothetical protein